MTIFYLHSRARHLTQTADDQSRIKALTAEIEQLQKTLDQLMKEREMLGYKKQAPRLDVGQKLDAIFKAV